MLIGVTIAGGQSTRMGLNKALLSGPGDVPLWKLAHAKLCAICELSAIALHDSQQAQALAIAASPDQPIIFDKLSDAGAISALHSACVFSRSHQADALLALPLDLPLLPSAWLSALVAALASNDSAYLGDSAEIQGQPLVAAFTMRGAEQALHLIEAGERSAFRLHRALGSQAVNASSLEISEADYARGLLNVNSPEDYARAQAHWQRAQGDPRG